MASPLLEVKDVTKAFAGVVAVNRLDLTVDEGEIVALVGENGAGKSTMIKMVPGEYVPDAGDIRLFGGFGRTAWWWTQSRQTGLRWAPIRCEQGKQQGLSPTRRLWE
jgi:ABC-type sugar transport system ATPase subunit